MKQRLIALAIILALTLAAWSASEHQEPNAGLPVVNADYPLCVTVKPGPVVPPRRDVFHPNANGELI